MLTFTESNRPPQKLIDLRLSMDHIRFLNQHHNEWLQYDWDTTAYWKGQFIFYINHSRCINECLNAQLAFIKEHTK